MRVVRARTLQHRLSKLGTPNPALVAQCPPQPKATTVRTNDGVMRRRRRFAEPRCERMFREAALEGQRRREAFCVMIAVSRCSLSSKIADLESLWRRFWDPRECRTTTLLTAKRTS